MFARRFRIVLCFLILSLFAFGLLAQERSLTRTHFRNTRWGMSREQVKASEASKLLKDDGRIIMYDGEVASLKTYVAYMFTGDQLTRGSYQLLTKHSQQNDYIDDFERLKKLLVEKYGKPNKDIVNWKDSLYKDDPQKYGFAVSLGHLVYGATWETPETNIMVMLSGDNYKINLEVNYFGAKLMPVDSEESKRIYRKDL
jgi:hypothetical protein